MRKSILILLLIVFIFSLSACGKSLEEKKSDDIEKLKITLVEEGWSCTNTKCILRTDDEPYESTSSETTYTTTGWTNITFDLLDYEFTINVTNSVSSNGDIGTTNVKITSISTSTFIYNLGKNESNFNSFSTSQTKFNNIIQQDRTTSETSEGHYLISSEKITCTDSDDRECLGKDTQCDYWYDYLLNIFIEADIEMNNFKETE